MPSRQIWAPAVFIAGLAVLAACENPGGLSTGGFRSDYLVARQALETGNYDLAIRRYQSLMRNAGPVEPRLRLEYAHGLLRANRFDDAAREAGAVFDLRLGTVSGAALAVRGTARHEAARARLATGQRDAPTVALLYQAVEDLETFVREHPELDADDMMAERVRVATSELRALGS